MNIRPVPDSTRRAELAARGLGERQILLNEGEDTDYVSDIIMRTYGKS